MRHNKQTCRYCCKSDAQIEIRTFEDKQTRQQVTRRVFNVRALFHRAQIEVNQESTREKQEQRQRDKSRSVRLSAYRVLSTRDVDKLLRVAR